MELFYYKDEKGNFGDDLNPYLWEQVWPGFKKYQHADWLIGVGSILTGKINELPGKKLIMGSGYWPIGAGKPNLSRCQLGFVRGPLTCRALGLGASKAIIDPAVLMSKLVNKTASKKGGVAFIPHHITHNFFNCHKIANQLGVRYIDPTWDYMRVVENILESDRIVTEAMHGAIIADSFGIPWQRVSIFNRRYASADAVDFKWEDWGRSLNIQSTPTFEWLLPWPGRTSVRRIIKMPYIEYCLSKLGRKLASAIKYGEYRLSDRKFLMNKINRLEKSIEKFKV